MRACLFISLMKAVCHPFSPLPDQSTEPPHEASSFAASFPEGSISPQSNCQMVYSYPSASWALVPGICMLPSEIVTVNVLTSVLVAAAIWRTVQKVIILVRLAISQGRVGLRERITFQEGYQTRMKLQDFMNFRSGRLLEGRMGCFFQETFSVESVFISFLLALSSLPYPFSVYIRLGEYFSLLRVQLLILLFLAIKDCDSFSPSSRPGPIFCVLLAVCNKSFPEWHFRLFSLRWLWAINQEAYVLIRCRFSLKFLLSDYMVANWAACEVLLNLETTISFQRQSSRRCSEEMVSFCYGGGGWERTALVALANTFRTLIQRRRLRLASVFLLRSGKAEGLDSQERWKVFMWPDIYYYCQQYRAGRGRGGGEGRGEGRERERGDVMGVIREGSRALYNIMIQKRRQEFRKEIRRKQLDIFMRESRLKLIESCNIVPQIPSSSRQACQDRISAILQNLSTAIAQQETSQIDAHFKEIMFIVQGEKELASFSLVHHAGRVRALIGKVIKNRTVLAQGSAEWSQIDTCLQIRVINGFLRLFCEMGFRDASQEGITELAQSFWPLFCFQQIDLSQHPPLFLQLLKTTRHMLSYNSRVVAWVFKELNFSYHLSQSIKQISSLSKESVVALVEVMYVHLAQENQLQSGKNRCQIGGIDILGMVSAEYEVFSTFCMKIVRKKIGEALYASIGTLIIIFARYPHLTSQADTTFVRQLTLLIKKSPQVRMKKRVLELLCDILTIETEIGHNLLQNNYCPDILLDFLQGYAKQADRDAYELTYIIGCIMSNLTLSENRAAKRLFLHHPIWKFALQHSNHPSSPFFPLIGVFEYFFCMANQKETMEALEEYLYALSCFGLPMAKERESKAIYRTIERICYSASNSPDKDALQRVKRLFEQYNMLPLIEQHSLSSMQTEQDILPVPL